MTKKKTNDTESNFSVDMPTISTGSVSELEHSEETSEEPGSSARVQDQHPGFRHLHTFSEDRIAKMRTAGILK